MSILKDILDKLAAKDRELLLYAFENDLSAYICLGEAKDTFIGVNTEFIKKLKPEITIGKWTFGKVEA